MKYLFLLVSIYERDASVTFFETIADANKKMEAELEEAADGDLDSYRENFECGIEEGVAAWITTNEANYDWLIVEIPA